MIPYEHFCIIPDGCPPKKVLLAELYLHVKDLFKGYL